MSTAFVFTPVAPGYHQYGATTLVNGCRAYDLDGTAIAEVLINYAYAGESVIYAEGKCGENIVTLNAYDNMLSAIENDFNGAYDRAIPLNCTNCDDDGTMTPGKWSIDYDLSTVDDCGDVDNAIFTKTSDDPFLLYPDAKNDPRATFTGDPGTYILRWTVQYGPDPEIDICFDEVTIQITNCEVVDFDGENDNITFRDNYNLNDEFSIEFWMKPDAKTNSDGDNNDIQTIISKRNAYDVDDNSGFDLRLEGTSLSFNWNRTGSLVSPYLIYTDRWYHIAITRAKTGKIYILYVDGIEVNNDAGNPPKANNFDFIVGAMDQTGNPPNKPVNYFSGWIDEIRIWNKTLNPHHIRQMMNQQIDDSGGSVIGDVIPLIVHGPDTDGDGTEDDILSWSNLEGYYRMNKISCGYLEPYGGVGVPGKLRNITSIQEETAPLPYTTIRDGNWNNTTATTPWTYGDTVWDYPNSTGYNDTPIDWNIVRISHDIDSDNQDITLLGLLTDLGTKLTISDPTYTTAPNAGYNENNPGIGLWVSHYLKLNGFMDLVGESQLVQKRYTTDQFSESILDVMSSGYLERDQQGTSNLYNYNYWGPPVGPQIMGSNNNTYGISGILRDGTDSSSPAIIQWTSSYDADGSTTPITLSRRWIWAYENYPQNTYAEWSYKEETGTLAAGLSYIMKGSGVGTAVQNYTFIGKPNNGTITNPINSSSDALVGNPYASAIDAHEFIKDNFPGVGRNPGSSESITGDLYFWEHYSANDTHILRDYQGGYAILNLSGSVAAVTPPITTDLIVIVGGSGSLVPKRYIPVGQGFFVNADENISGMVTFKNSQRVFEREISASSVFFRSANNSKSSPPDNSEEDDLIKRIRLEFKSPEGATRPLLLAFVPNNQATDGFDYGYDAKFYDDNSPSYMGWMISDEPYVIQGVGDFDKAKQYPIGIFLSTSGRFEIELTELENFSEPIDVFIYDSLFDSYTKINDNSFGMSIDADDYLDRFYITFKQEIIEDDNDVIETEDDFNQTIVNYLNSSGEIYIHVPKAINVKQVYLINLLGQTVKSWNVTNTPNLSGNEFKIPVKNISEGNYIIRVETNRSTINKMVIITQ